MLDVADGALGPSHEPSNAFVAFAPNPGREFDRHANTDLIFPVGTDPRQIVREHEGGARAIHAMDRNDGLIGQREAWIEITDRLGVPFDDLAEIDVRKNSPCESKLSWPDALHVHDWHHPAHDERKLGKAGSGQLTGTKWSIGRSEIHRPALDLSDADARTNGLVVDLGAGQGLVGFRPLGQNRIHKG